MTRPRRVTKFTLILQDKKEIDLISYLSCIMISIQKNVKVFTL